MLLWFHLHDVEGFLSVSESSGRRRWESWVTYWVSRSLESDSLQVNEKKSHPSLSIAKTPSKQFCHQDRYSAHTKNECSRRALRLCESSLSIPANIQRMIARNIENVEFGEEEKGSACVIVWPRKRSTDPIYCLALLLLPLPSNTLTNQFLASFQTMWNPNLAWRERRQ